MELYHHGVLGMKWGVRRYQNKDGSLTPLGQKHRNQLDVEPDKVKANSKRGLSLYKEKYDKLYSDRFDEDDKAYSECEQKIEAEIKKKLGMSYEEARKAAINQNELIDRGKLKYKKSLWNTIHEIEDKHYEEYSKKEKEIKERYKKQFVKDAEEYAERLLSETGKNSISYDDIAKMPKNITITNTRNIGRIE